MLRWLANTYELGCKELSSVARDRGMILFIVWAFTGAVYLVVSGAGTEMRQASVGFADLDRSQMSSRLQDALQPPSFAPPKPVEVAEIAEALNRGRFTFVVHVPPRFEQDLLAGRRPEVQLIVDATAMTQAWIGVGYATEILLRTVDDILSQRAMGRDAVRFTVRSFFNPNLDDHHHSAVSEIVNNVTLLSIILVGAAVVREREHGTIEHLLVMPVRPSEIIAAKIWANGLIVLVAVTSSLIVVAQALLGIVITGSIGLYLVGAALFVFAIMALGIMLSTLTPSMPQFALVAFPTVIVMDVLSGGMTPIESMPDVLRTMMSALPSTHYVAFSQGVLFRGASWPIVWPDLAWMAGLGLVYSTIALARFRRMLAKANGS